MSRARTWVALGLIALGGGVLLFSPAIPQDPAYHNFADQRALLGRFVQCGLSDRGRMGCDLRDAQNEPARQQRIPHIW